MRNRMLTHEDAKPMAIALVVSDAEYVNGNNYACQVCFVPWSLSNLYLFRISISITKFQRPVTLEFLFHPAGTVKITDGAF